MRMRMDAANRKVTRKVTWFGSMLVLAAFAALFLVAASACAQDKEKDTYLHDEEPSVLLRLDITADGATFTFGQDDKYVFDVENGTLSHSHDEVTLSPQSFERLQRLLELLYRALDRYTGNFSPIYPDSESDGTDEQSRF